MGVWVLYSVHSVCVSPSRQRVRSRVGARDIEVITVPHPPVYELLWCHVSVIKPYYRPIDYAHRTTLRLYFSSLYDYVTLATAVVSASCH